MAPLYFPNLIRINYDLMLRMKWLWFVPNLMQIASIFLKLQAVKQSGPGFLAYPVDYIKIVYWWEDKRKGCKIVVTGEKEWNAVLTREWMRNSKCEWFFSGKELLNIANGYNWWIVIWVAWTIHIPHRRSSVTTFSQDPVQFTIVTGWPSSCL